MRAQCNKCTTLIEVDAEGLCRNCREEEKLIGKIQKLLALSKSPNKAEAELAAQRAHELLTKYNLSMDDVQEREIREFNIISGRNLKTWKHLLIDNVARYYYCKSLFYERGSGYYRIVFIGQRHNIIVCKSMFDYLHKTILRESRSIHKNAKNKYREDFKLGMAVKISERLKQLSDQKIIPEEKDLVIRENDKIDKYLSEKNTYSENFELDIKKAEAYWKGIQAGKKVSLNEQIKSNRNSRRIV